MSSEVLFDSGDPKSLEIFDFPIQVEEDDGRSESDLSQQDEETFEIQASQEFDSGTSSTSSPQLISTSAPRKRGRPLKKKSSLNTLLKKRALSPSEGFQDPSLSPETPPVKRKRGRPKKYITYSSSSESLTNYQQEPSIYSFIDEVLLLDSTTDQDDTSKALSILETPKNSEYSSVSDVELTNCIRNLINQYQSQITFDQIKQDLSERFGQDLFYSRKWFISEVVEMFQF